MLAIVLAGGKGTRLRPFTTTIPKPLVPVGERPILSIVIDQLQSAGVERVILAINHMAELIMGVFGDGERHNICIEYSVEREPLGTMGPLRLLSDLPENFLVMNGDVLTDLDYRVLFQSHIASGSDLTIATYSREVASDFGVLRIEAGNNRVVGFEEKPVFRFDVSMGVYVFRRSVIERVPRDRPYGFDDLVIDMLARGDRIGSHRHYGYWLDLGRPEDYDRANQDYDALFTHTKSTAS